MCKDVIYNRNSDLRQKTMLLTKRPSSGVNLQNNMKSNGEQLLHFNLLRKKALDELNKFHIMEVRHIHFLKFTNVHMTLFPLKPCF